MIAVGTWEGGGEGGGRGGRKRKSLEFDICAISACIFSLITDNLFLLFKPQ